MECINIKSDYCGSYQIKLKSWEGVDTSQPVMLFPGQGSLPAYKKWNAISKVKEIQKYLNIADEFCDDLGIQSVSSWLQSKNRSNDQPILSIIAMAVIEMGLFDCFKNSGIIPRGCIGFSAGESVALVAMGIISFRTLLSLLHLRDLGCPKPFQTGSLIAVAENAERVGDIISENQDIVIANICSPKQCVIAVKKGFEKSTIRLLKNEKISAIPLKTIPQPYHAQWLEEASKVAYGNIIDKEFEIFPATLPLYSFVDDWNNVGVKPSREWIAKLISKSLVSKVDFPNQLLRATENQCGSFLEMSFEGTLTKFVGEIFSDGSKVIFDTEKLFPYDLSIESQQNEIEFKNYPFLQKLLNRVASITGYEITSFQMQNRLQEDLGIDSIKKAELIFTVAQENKIQLSASTAMSDIKSLADICQLLADPQTEVERPKEFLERKGEPARLTLNWIEDKIISDENTESRDWIEIRLPEATEDIAQFFLELQNQIELVDTEEVLSIRIIGENINRGDDFRNDAKWAEVFFTNYQLLWKKIIKRKCDLILIVDEFAPVKWKALSGFFYTLAQESNELFFRNLSVDVLPSSKDELDKLCQTELQQPFNFNIRIINGMRQIGEYVAIEHTEKIDKMETQENWLVLGGGRGITHSLLKAAGEKSICRRAIIVGRTKNNNTDLLSNIEELRKFIPDVQYISTNLRKSDNVQLILNEAVENFGHVDVVVNGLGIELSESFENIDDKSFASVLETKLNSTTYILNLIGKIKPKKIFLFSSIAGSFGNFGQTIYAYANAWLDQLSNQFREHETKITSLVWAPWDAVGMTENRIVMQRLRSILISLLDEQSAKALFLSEVVSNESHPVVLLCDALDIWAFRTRQIPMGNIGKIIGSAVSDFTYERNFSLAKDNWLEDHLIDGTCYVPASYMLTGLLLFADKVNSEKTILKSFSIKNPCVVPRDGSSSLKMKSFSTGKNSRFTVGYSNSIIYEAEFEELDLVHESSKRRVSYNSSKIINAKKYYADGRFFHGHRFQLLNDVEFNSDSMKYQTFLSLNKLASDSGNIMGDRLVTVIEALFQLAGIAASETYKIKTLPIGVEGVTVFDTHKLCKNCFLEVSKIKFNSVDAMMSGEVLDTEGYVLVGIESIFMKKVN